MIEREKVMKGLECCADLSANRAHKCTKECPYDFEHNDNCMGDMARDALELLKNEPNAPAENKPSASTEDTAYQRLMEIYRDLIERNTKLAEEAQKLAQFNDNLARLCEALIKKVYADEKKS